MIRVVDIGRRRGSMDHDTHPNRPRVATVAQSPRTLDDVPLAAMLLDNVLVETDMVLRGKPAGGSMATIAAHRRCKEIHGLTVGRSRGRASAPTTSGPGVEHRARYRDCS